jgi:hypothetical protein
VSIATVKKPNLLVDDIGGYHPDEKLRKWNPGSCWESEGRKLYQTVREMRPDVICEIGRWEGCSTAHLALGCKHNGKGRVYSIDIASGMGSKIPPDLLPWVEFINADVFTLTGDKVAGGKPIDLLLEDGQHTTGFTEYVLRNFKARRIIVHDFCHWDCLTTTRDESLRVLGEPDEVFQEDSDCGYGIWRFDK